MGELFSHTLRVPVVKIFKNSGYDMIAIIVYYNHIKLSLSFVSYVKYIACDESEDISDLLLI